LWLHSLGDTVKSGKKASEYEKLILDEMGTFLEETDIEVYKKALQKGSEDMVYEAELLFQGSEKIQTEIDELLQSLEEKYLKDKLVRAMHDLHLSETKKDTKRAEELIQLCQDISNKLSLLNKKKKN